MTSNCLQLNPFTAEAIWCRFVYYRFNDLPLVVDDVTVQPSPPPHSQSLDNDRVRPDDVYPNRQAYCFVLQLPCQLCSIPNQVFAPVVLAIVTSLVLTRLNYCNSTLTAQPAIRRLQYTQNAHFVYMRWSEDVANALIRIHICQYIGFKTEVLVFRALHGTTLSYLMDRHWESSTLRNLAFFSLQRVYLHDSLKYATS